MLNIVPRYHILKNLILIREETKYPTKFAQDILAWKKIAEKGDIPAGKSKEYNVDGKRIAVFNQDGYHALDALCVHQDGSIVPGKLEGDIVECPLHFWHYNIKTGELLDYLKGVKLQKYPVEARNDGIYLDA